ncbi:MAG: formate dehydrogenase accessory sulfurtransferase FdhD [Bacteroidota bacterium]
MLEQVKSVSIDKITQTDANCNVSDLLAVEEPLEIRIGYGPESHREQKSLSVTMRTPGYDHELALGFLYTEGVITSFDNVEGIRHCQDLGKEETGNVVRVELRPEVLLDFNKLQRHFYTTSSCGVCGKSSLESISKVCEPIQSELETPPKIICQALELLNISQTTFKHTGGIHATGLFNAKGDLIILREDVGRHNALDKVLGAAIMKGMIPLKDYFILVSGRASFELVQKAVMAGVPLLAAVGAPSSLAAQLASELGLTLIGFLKEDRFNIYSRPERVIL